MKTVLAAIAIAALATTAAQAQAPNTLTPLQIARCDQMIANTQAHLDDTIRGIENLQTYRSGSEPQQQMVAYMFTVMVEQWDKAFPECGLKAKYLPSDAAAEKRAADMPKAPLRKSGE